MFISAIAQRAGVSVHTIRFYEQERLISRPARSAAGYRVYGDRVLLEIAFIKRAQRLGFTLDETREILTLGRSGRTPCERVSALCDRHLKEIDRRMAELRTFRQNLKNARRLAADACGYTSEGFCRAIFADG